MILGWADLIEGPEITTFNVPNYSRGKIQGSWKEERMDETCEGREEPVRGLDRGKRKLLQNSEDKR